MYVSVGERLRFVPRWVASSREMTEGVLAIASKMVSNMLVTSDRIRKQRRKDKSETWEL